MITSCNHKVVGLGYLWMSLLQGIWGILLSLIIRTELATSGIRLLSNQNNYNLTFTLHGLIMIFFLVMPNLYSGFGNYFVPLYLASSEVTYPRVNNISLVLLPISFLLLCISLLTEYGYGTGWTIYPPLSTKSQELVILVLSLYFVGLSSVLASVNFITTMLSIRHVGKMIGEMTFLLWGIMIVALLLVLTIPVLTSGLLMLIADLCYCTVFFDPEFSGDPILYQHLFWLFGHPEVYIIILPAFAIVSEILSNSILGATSMILAMGCIGIIGSLVWGHHMNTVGLDTDTRGYYTSITILISIPTGTKVFNWLSARGIFNSASLVTILFIMSFTLGGTTGVLLGSAGMDVGVHDTYYVVAHFHFVLSIGAILGIISAWTYYEMSMLGLQKKEEIEYWVSSWAFMIGVFLALTPLHGTGFSMQPRRVSDWDLNLTFLNICSSIGALITPIVLII